MRKRFLLLTILLVLFFIGFKIGDSKQINKSEKDINRENMERLLDKLRDK